MSDIKRFWSLVDKSGKCWEWRGTRDRGGYGQFYARMSATPRLRAAHRFSWAQKFGKIPHGMCICHHCDNPPCVRPSHLFLGTYLDNARDRVAKRREITGLPPMDPRDTERLIIGLTDRQLHALKAYAALDGQHVSSWAQTVLVNAIAVPH